MREALEFYVRVVFAILCLTVLLASGAGYAQIDASSQNTSIEDLLIGSWKVADREFDVENMSVRQTGGVVHVTERLPDGTFLVLVTISTHLSNKDGSDRPLPECDGKKECIHAGATEAVGVYSNGRFSIDYYGENWYDDVFTIDGTTMSGRDPNGSIHLTKTVRSAK